MGTISLQLPAGLSADDVRELEHHTCMAGGPDNMPWPTEVSVEDGRLIVKRAVDESGFLVAPWTVPGFGQLMGTTATLTERATPYQLLTELARGKVNQVRCQAADWRIGGLQLPEELVAQMREASQTFGKAVTAPPEESGALAEEALRKGYQGSRQLVETYAQQVFHIRHQRQAQLDTTLGCRVAGVPGTPEQEAALRSCCNSVCLPLSWHLIEPEERTFRWDQTDALLTWADNQGLEVTAGPLIDFSSSQLPIWLWLWERDVPNLANFMYKFVEAAVRRYRTRIRRWQLTAASNWASVLSLTEDELLGLTYRLGEAARQVDPTLELVVSITQPWGEYMARADRTHSPFIFADTLIRSGLNLAALDIEVVMGATPRGSYTRDLLDLSRLLDLYALLGVPLQVTLGYPSSDRPDADADPDLRVGAGSWESGFTPEIQADWASACAALALCKPYVRSVQWTHFSDLQPHLFPHCGLVNHQGQLKPAVQVFQDLRATHLR